MPARIQLDLDLILKRLDALARVLPAITPRNAPAERRRLAHELSAGRDPAPRFEVTPRRLPSEAFPWLDQARALAPEVPAGPLYLARLDELALDLSILESLGDPRRIRPLARRRYGTGATRVETAGGEAPVSDLAKAILSTVEPDPEPRLLPASAPPGERSLAELMRRVAGRARLEMRVCVEPRLAAAAAAGERVVFVADRSFGAREAWRLAVHEVLGHLVSAANGRAQPLRLVELGTAGSFTDQEGVALFLEEQAGVMDGTRLRTLAARVVATDLMHDGAPFGAVARRLAREHDFSATDAITLAERAFRGGGIARDACYLRGWLRVRRAVRRGDATVDELRSGRIGLDDLSALRELEGEGLYRAALLRPSLAYSLEATDGGTSLLTSPPSLAASFTMFEET